MRIKSLIIAGFVACISSTTARADQYRWCAAYGGSEEGSYNCYFVTLQQCQAAVSGVGGFCIPSPYTNTAPLTAPAPIQRQKKSS